MPWQEIMKQQLYQLYFYDKYLDKKGDVALRAHNTLNIQGLEELLAKLSDPLVELFLDIRLEAEFGLTPFANNAAVVQHMKDNAQWPP